MKDNNHIRIKWIFLLICVCMNLVSNVFSQQTENYYDFSMAKMVISQTVSEAEQTAIKMMVEEIEKRTTIEIPTIKQWPDSSTPVIIVAKVNSLYNGPFDKSTIVSSNRVSEGFKISVTNEVRNAPTLFIIGNDARGVLFGIGYLLRKSSMYPGKLHIPHDINADTYPMIPLRGHQLGYRPKTNSYDGFNEEMWEQYIRDLIVFGTNSIELLPPNTDDASTSPMFPLPQMEMMIILDNILEKYNLNEWIWYPLMYGDYSEAENVKKSLEENESVFSQLSKIDAIFVPGGDPGHTPPKVLFDYLEKETQLLHQFHPNAEMWVSPQGFNAEWMEEFLQLLKEEPAWLTGVVQGPQVRMNVDDLRKAVPAKYPIRRYPDITHNLDAQYPVPNWDFAFAATQNRESINPRPMDQYAIFHATSMESYYGFITYSEGVKDDVNKIIWSGLGWNPDANLLEILYDYSRYFIGPDYTDDFTQGLLNLERNWDGPLLGNSEVYTNHSIFQSMEKKALPDVRLNWRFQMALYRSYYDAYNRSRLLYETQLEDEVMNLLRKAPELGSLTVMDQAEVVLDKARLKTVAGDWRQRVFELAEALFQSTRMQLSVEKYYAIAVRRGANLDLMNYPFNNRLWLQEQFNRIAQLKTEEDRINEIEKITNWNNPGPGGFYDDLGSLGNQPHLIVEENYMDDPSFYNSPFVGFALSGNTMHWRTSWKRYMQTLYDHSLKMHYSNLDQTAQYQLKVTYVSKAVRLIADEDIVVHDYLKSDIVGPMTFDIPFEATKDGELTLKWNVEFGHGGTGRGCQIAEVWLMKE